MSDFENLWASLLSIVAQHKELETTDKAVDNEEEALSLLSGFINQVDALQLIIDGLRIAGYNVSQITGADTVAIIESFRKKIKKNPKDISQIFWTMCKSKDAEILQKINNHMRKIGALEGGSKRKQRSRTNKRRNRTKRLYKKRRNTKRKNTKRRNTKRRNTKRRNTKRRV